MRFANSGLIPAGSMDATLSLRQIPSPSIILFGIISPPGLRRGPHKDGGSQRGPRTPAFVGGGAAGWPAPSAWLAGNRDGGWDTSKKLKIALGRGKFVLTFKFSSRH